MYWLFPRLWPGETVVCLGGGPSLTREQVDYCRERARVIAINDAYLLAPWADLLYFCDRRWFEWQADRPELKAFRGIKVTLDEHVLKNHPEIKGVKNTGRHGLDMEPPGVRTGRNSGYQAINVAVHLGVKRIVLLGYDMRVVEGRTHWHAGHPVPQRENIYETSMLPCFKTLVKPLAECGVEVINATPNSALTVFHMKQLQEALDG